MALTAKKKTLGKSELSLFASQLAMLVKGGVSLYDAMTLLENNVENDEYFARLYKSIKDGVASSRAFNEALEETGAFPYYFVQMVKIGEVSGRLDEVLDSLGVYYEKSEYVSQSIKSATRYPVIIIAVLLVVLGVIVTKVLPVFAGVYEQLGLTMTGITRSLMSFGSFLNANGLLILIIIAAIAAFCIVFFRTEKGKAFCRKMYENGIFTKKMARHALVGKLAYAFSLCISSGMNIDEGLDMADKLVGSEAISENIKQIKQNMASGDSFAAALGKTPLFPPVYVGMIQVGIKTGMLDETMKNVAERYSMQTDEQINKSISVIEPTLVIFISVAIGLLLLAVMLPLINVMSTL